MAWLLWPGYYGTLEPNNKHVVELCVGHNMTSQKLPHCRTNQLLGHVHIPISMHNSKRAGIILTPPSSDHISISKEGGVTYRRLQALSVSIGSLTEREGGSGWQQPLYKPGGDHDHTLLLGELMRGAILY